MDHDHGFAEETDKEGDTRDQSNTNGCPAMDDLLKCMKDENPDDKPTKYGSFILWSDGFIRSFVKQKENDGTKRQDQRWKRPIIHADPGALWQ